MKKLILTAGTVLSLSAHAATITVTSTSDTPVNGKTTLREAITQANDTAGADRIEFNITGNTPAERTITLDGSEIVISDDLTIDGGTAGMTISGDKKSRIFSVSKPLTIERLTLTGGNGAGAAVSGDGGAIYTTANLTINHSTLTGNTSQYSGGGDLRLRQRQRC